jgi:hypothetical protein
MSRFGPAWLCRFLVSADYYLRGLAPPERLRLWRNDADATEYQFASQRGGVNRRTVAGQYLQADAAREVVNGVDEVAQVAAQPVEFPNNPGVPARRDPDRTFCSCRSINQA